MATTRRAATPLVARSTSSTRASKAAAPKPTTGDAAKVPAKAPSKAPSRATKAPVKAAPKATTKAAPKAPVKAPSSKAPSKATRATKATKAAPPVKLSTTQDVIPLNEGDLRQLIKITRDRRWRAGRRGDATLQAEMNARLVDLIDALNEMLDR